MSDVLHAPEGRTLTIAPDAWRTLTLYTTVCPFEIGGLGLVEWDGDDLRLEELHVLPQEVNDIATRLDGEAVSHLIESVIERGHDPAAIRCWWHSHARELPFWSGEDEQTIAGFQNDWMVSLVTNHEMRLLARLDRYQPRRTEWVAIRQPEPIEFEPDEIERARAFIQENLRYVRAERRGDHP